MQIIYKKDHTNLLLGDGVKTSNAHVQAGDTFARGDLVKIDDDGVMTAASLSEFNAVVAVDVDAPASQKHSNQKTPVPIYTHGELNVMALKQSGQLINKDSYDTVIARADKATSLTIKKPFDGGQKLSTT